ncbi:MAG: secretin and TonB N-terminal domain-containing protein [Acidobacteriota bacterium]
MRPPGGAAGRRRRRIHRSPWRLRGLILASALVVCSAVAARDASARVDLEPSEPQAWIGEPVTMTLRDADLVETLRSLARVGEFNLIVQPGVRGSVTMELNDVPWDQALAIVLRTHGLAMELTDGVISIASPEHLLRQTSAPSLETALLARIVTLRGTTKHVPAQRFLSLFGADADRYLGTRGTVEIASDGALVVRAPRHRIERIRRIVSRLDTPEAVGLDAAELARRARALR